MRQPFSLKLSHSTLLLLVNQLSDVDLLDQHPVARNTRVECFCLD